ncbi:MAG TPA: hypothetical protein EYP55_01170, partial [Anaerolineae bacterium]|nr:hypothetical protein [Anaerolineae bacterium]
IKARRQALEALVKSSSVAAEVVAKLGSMLEPEERDVSALLGMVETESNGDLIGIKVRGKDPGKITAIANAWGKAYERYVNELYGGRLQPLGSIQAQVAEARESYQEAEETLAKFLGDNQIDALSREIAAKKDTLADYYATKRQLDRFIADAKALREQLRGGTHSSQAAARNSLSLLILKANASNVSSALPMQPSALPMQPSALPMQLQLSLGQIPSGDEERTQLMQEVEILIANLEARRAGVQQFIDETPLQQEILQLEEQLEREQARQRELTQARDLAWETYQTLARKEAEVQVASQVQDTEVRFAVPAVEPERPVAPKKMMNIAIAGVLGLMVGVFGAFFIEFLESGERGE